MVNNLITFVPCHNQDIIIEFINTNKYNHNVIFLFLGMGDVDKLREHNNVIICRELKNNIEENKNCLQYCGWYAALHNDLIGEQNYIRIVDYDIDIINHEITMPVSLKGTIVYDWNFYFYDGFGDNIKLQNQVHEISGETIFELIDKHKGKFNQTKWFSSIDTIMTKKFFIEFMEWFEPIYNINKNDYYFGMHFERFLTIYSLIKNIDYEVSSGETNHVQLKSHEYY